MSGPGGDPEEDAECAAGAGDSPAAAAAAIATDDHLAALVALARREALGEAAAWGDVRAVISDMRLDVEPAPRRLLRIRLAELNDGAALHALEDWLDHAAELEEAAGRRMARAGDKVLTPLQNVGFASLGGVGGSVVLEVFPLGLAAPVLLAAALVMAAASYGRWALDAGRDRADLRAIRLRKLSSVAAARREAEDAASR